MIRTVRKFDASCYFLSITPNTIINIYKIFIDCFVLQLMVAQKDGTIRLFSLHNDQPFMSMKCGSSPLMSADWSRHNNLLIGAVAGSEWFVFNISLSR